MIVTLARRSLLSHPVRTAVLAGGFGLGVAVMAALLGVGSAILDQARAPALSGGGDVAIGGAAGRILNARYVLSSVLGQAPLAARVAAAAPTARTTLYLIDGQGRPAPIRVTGEVPSLAGRVDPAGAVVGWSDAPSDRSWTSPDPAQVLRSMDRFHRVPDVPARASSWAEWLYFNGRTSDARFYLTFMAGPRESSGRRTVGVRLQLERGGRMTSYAERAEIDDDQLLAGAPDVEVKGSRVRLEGLEYRITLDLPSQSGAGRASGTLIVRATAGRSLPPFEIHGAGGWVSGYTVPVMSGTLGGALRAGGATIDFDGGAAYHDHNWGFWDGVSWQWGQVQGQGLSFVYGRVHPPADAADAARVPGFLAAFGPQGLLGYATDVVIDETNDPSTGRPRTVAVRGESDALALRLDFVTRQTTATGMQRGRFGGGLDFLQLRGDARVTGRVGREPIDFTAPASAETFRGATRTAPR